MTTVPFYDLAALHREIASALDGAWRDTLSGGVWIGGPPVDRFAEAFAAFCGVSHGVGTGNGLDALAIALEAGGIGPGDEVLVPAHTFVATWLAVAMVGARPVPVEPVPGRFNADAAGLRAAIGPATRAIVAVHLYGEPVDLAPLAALARERGILLVEDAAQAHGAAIGGRRAGGLGDVAAFSFYPSKNLGALGDGGMIVTDDADLAERARLIGNYGSPRRYEHVLAGRNSRLDTLQAAVLSAKLPYLEGWNARRARLAARYAEGLADVPGLALPPDPPPGAAHAWHHFVVRAADRDGLARALAARGVGTQIHYPRPAYRHPPFADRGPEGESEADRLAARILSLPMGPQVTDVQADHVIAAVRAAMGAPCGVRAQRSSAARTASTSTEKASSARVREPGTNR